MTKLWAFGNEYYVLFKFQHRLLALRALSLNLTQILCSNPANPLSSLSLSLSWAQGYLLKNFYILTCAIIIYHPFLFYQVCVCIYTYSYFYISFSCASFFLSFILSQYSDYMSRFCS